jgi:predicted AlkP superfamily phosphohydrolase/phosphomutase
VAKVLVVAIDSLEPVLLRRFLDEGRLPNLARHIPDAQALDVTSQGGFLHGSVWPTFSTGTSPGQHGIYFWTQWFAEDMAHDRNARLWTGVKPFWRALIPAGRKATVVDVPYVPPVEAPGFRTCIGWGLHDEIVARSSPAEFRTWIDKTFGRNPLTADTLEPHTPREKLEMTSTMRKGVEMRTRLLEALVSRPDWDFLLVNFSEVHEAGHYLTGSETIAPGLSNLDAMAKVLEPLDRAWPRIVAAAGPDCDVLFLALMGMFEQRDFEAFGAQILALFQGKEPTDHAAHPDLIRRVRELLPNSVHRAIWTSMPAKWRVGRVNKLRAQRNDYETARLFTVVHDTQPAVRINLAGRETPGIVQPEEAPVLLDSLETLMRQFTTPEAQPAFLRLWRAAVEEPGPNSHRLPDAIMFTNPEVKQASELIGPDGIVLMSSHREARNGNHSDNGFCYFWPAKGKSANRKSVNNLDFAPSLLDLLEVPYDRDFQGKSFVG